MGAVENNNRKGNRKEGGEGDSSNATWHEIASAATVSLLFSCCLSLATSSPLLVSNPTVLSFLFHTIREREGGLLSLSGSPAAVLRRGGGRRALIGEREEEGASQRERKR